MHAVSQTRSAGLRGVMRLMLAQLSRKEQKGEESIKLPTHFTKALEQQIVKNPTPRLTASTIR
jgi:hypothetical protein